MTTKTHTTYTTWVVTRLFIGSRLSQIRVFNECPRTDTCIVQMQHYRWGEKELSHSDLQFNFQLWENCDLSNFILFRETSKQRQQSHIIYSESSRKSFLAQFWQKPQVQFPFTFLNLDQFHCAQHEFQQISQTLRLGVWK